LAPKLQRQDNFKNAVSRLSWELALDREFISGSPQRPALGSKICPEQSVGFSSKRIQNHDPILPKPRVLVHTEHFPNPIPQNFR
jgi:hypothetical protein